MIFVSVIRMIYFLMTAFIYKNQVGQFIVNLVSVKMVNIFKLLQRAIKISFHYKSMFKFIFSFSYSNLNISVSHYSSTFPSRIFLHDGITMAFFKKSLFSKCRSVITGSRTEFPFNPFFKAISLWFINFFPTFQANLFHYYKRVNHEYPLVKSWIAAQKLGIV